MKSPCWLCLQIVRGRTPRGVRGLKFPVDLRQAEQRESHPSRGAWIEIKIEGGGYCPRPVAPLAGCVD